MLGCTAREVYNTIQEISPAIADLLVELRSAISTRALTWISRNGTDYARIPINANKQGDIAESTHKCRLNVGIAPEQRRGPLPTASPIRDFNALNAPVHGRKRSLKNANTYQILH